MPKLICAECDLEMLPNRIGVTVVFMAHHPPRPYQLYQGDEKECPNCMHRCIDGLPTKCTGDYQDEFHEAILSALRHQPESVRLVWENTADEKEHGKGILYLQKIYADKLKGAGE